MSNPITKIQNKLQEISAASLRQEMKLYREMVRQINEVRLEEYTDSALLELSGDLCSAAKQTPPGELRVKASMC